MSADYETHLDELRNVLSKGIDVAKGEVHPTDRDHLYVWGLDVDGQYHTVMVGVGNASDVYVEVDSTTMNARVVPPGRGRLRA